MDFKESLRRPDIFLINQAGNLTKLHRVANTNTFVKAESSGNRFRNKTTRQSKSRNEMTGRGSRRKLEGSQNATRLERKTAKTRFRSKNPQHPNENKRYLGEPYDLREEKENKARGGSKQNLTKKYLSRDAEKTPDQNVRQLSTSNRYSLLSNLDVDALEPHHSSLLDDIVIDKSLNRLRDQEDLSSLAESSSDDENFVQRLDCLRRGTTKRKGKSKTNLSSTDHSSIQTEGPCQTRKSSDRRKNAKENEPASSSSNEGESRRDFAPRRRGGRSGFYKANTSMNSSRVWVIESRRRGEPPNHGSNENTSSTNSASSSPASYRREEVLTNVNSSLDPANEHTGDKAIVDGNDLTSALDAHKKGNATGNDIETNHASTNTFQDNTPGKVLLALTQDDLRFFMSLIILIQIWEASRRCRPPDDGAAKGTQNGHKPQRPLSKLPSISGVNVESRNNLVFQNNIVSRNDIISRNVIVSQNDITSRNDPAYWNLQSRRRGENLNFDYNLANASSSGSLTPLNSASTRRIEKECGGSRMNATRATDHTIVWEILRARYQGCL